MGGKRPVVLAGQRAFILDRIRRQPNISLRALAAELAERGITVSQLGKDRFSSLGLRFIV